MVVLKFIAILYSILMCLLYIYNDCKSEDKAERFGLKMATVLQIVVVYVLCHNCFFNSGR